MRRLAVALATLALGCSPHTLDLGFTIDSSCSISVPAGGSLLYELVTDGKDGGASPRQCGACIPVSTAIADVPTLLGVLRAQAPTCAIERSTSFTARVTAFTDPDCPGTTVLASLCSAPVRAGSGHDDQSSKVPLTCGNACNTSCVPLSCADQGKNCDSISDTCGGMLDCGSCQQPQKCGGAGVANVCGKP
jgi:hypothetical protein